MVKFATIQRETSFSCLVIIVIFITLSDVVFTQILESQYEEGSVFEKPFPPAPNDTKKDTNREKRNELGRRGSFVHPIRQLGPPSKGIPISLLELQCPPPPVTRSLEICYLRTCSNHQNCSKGDACCFNGCIKACTEPLAQPAAFDWIEDTSLILTILGPDFGENPPSKFTPIVVPQSYSTYAAAEAGEELVYMAGGCLISASQHTKLKVFADSPGIKQCRCHDGEVVCDVVAVKS